MTATATGPLPVLCVIEHLHRDRAVADAVADGRFTLAGITCELGLVPDWLGAALPEDEEWRIEWTKFYFGLDLAHAFDATGDRRYLAAWESLVGSWIDQVPHDHDVADVTARRLVNWLYAWQSFAAATAYDGLAEGLEEALRASIADQTRHVRANLHPARNHRTLELYALLMVGLALPELAGDGLAEEALADLHRNLRADFRPDGVHCEASTHYHVIALRSFVGALANAQRFGLALPSGFAERVERACAFALHCTRPDGGLPALSDADGGRYEELLALAGEVLERDDLRWVATDGREGTPPAETLVSFPDGGYWIQRSGWEDPARERFAIFDCGPLGDGGHGHYDLLSVELAGRGRALVTDPGRFTYAEGTPNLRHWFKGTAAHNTVTVDGLDQTPYAPRRPQGAVAAGRFLGRLTAPGLDVLTGEATSPAYEAVHHRTLAFVAGEYWIVVDRLHAAERHRYDVRWHLGHEARGATTLVRDEGQATVRTADLALVVAPGVRVALEDGWVAPTYGVRLPAPVVSAATEAADAHCTTLLMPLDAGRPAPALTVETDESRTMAAVDHEETHDLVALAAAPVRLTLGPLHTTARAAWLRRDADGTPVALAACDVTSLELDGRGSLLRERRPIAAVSWTREAGLIVREQAA
jgi:Heparinase II/III-like protein/Heparinase II/III N-terminus